MQVEHHNGFPAVAVYTLPDVDRVVALLVDRGLCTGLKIVKPTRKRRRKFLVLVYRRL